MGVLRVSHWCVGVITRPDWTLGVLEIPRLHMRASSNHTRPFVRVSSRYFDIRNLSTMLSVIILIFFYIKLLISTKE